MTYAFEPGSSLSFSLFTLQECQFVVQMTLVISLKKQGNANQQNLTMQDHGSSLPVPLLLQISRLR